MTDYKKFEMTRRQTLNRLWLFIEGFVIAEMFAIILSTWEASSLIYRTFYVTLLLCIALSTAWSEHYAKPRNNSTNNNPLRTMNDECGDEGYNSTDDAHTKCNPLHIYIHAMLTSKICTRLYRRLKGVSTRNEENPRAKGLDRIMPLCYSSYGHKFITTTVTEGSSDQCLDHPSGAESVSSRR